MDTPTGTLRLRRISGVRMCGINEIARTAMRIPSNRSYELEFIADDDGAVERLTVPEPMPILRKTFGFNRRAALDLIQSADLLADSGMSTWVELPVSAGGLR